jgi:hypothetical protein
MALEELNFFFIKINMKNKNIYNINYYLIRLSISPIIPYLSFKLGISLFLSLKYFEPAYLCGGECIEDLKNKLSEETIKYSETMKEMEDLKDKVRQAYQEKA